MQRPFWTDRSKGKACEERTAIRVECQLAGSPTRSSNVRFGVESSRGLCELLSIMSFQNRDWIELVKATREKFGVSIQGAHDLIFADKEMRKFVAMRVNRDAECRKMASQDIAINGEKSRFIRDGVYIRFRRADGQRM